jgi:hypothetical protein
MENIGAEISSIDANIAGKILFSMTKMHENAACEGCIPGCPPFPPFGPIDF